ncbi:MAG TPA: hypothetical protein VN814_04030 [Caulobacteraceae bacterium]|nr:hypothetical protein [Caulobacteraceae bacterium]
MRALLVALAMVGVAGVAGAQDNASPNGEVRSNAAARPVPPTARKAAEAAIRAGLTDPNGAAFRAEGAVVAASVKRAFGPLVEGPIAVVCGQFASRNPSGGYGGYVWFYAAIKDGQVLWTDIDDGSGAPDAAYDSCKGAGLAG